ncbi:unnamed protein product [Closterium sp. NIES-65]|nr:unnamed protein product [Closterium sp. NIES-65]
MSGVSVAPAANAHCAVRSQQTKRDAAARLAVRSHLPSAERAHFGQYKTARTLYDAVVARYSSPATAALSCLTLSYLDHFLSLCPTTLTVDLLEERLLAADKSIIAVGASRGDPRASFFEGCSLVPLLPSVASATAVDLVGNESVDAASAPSGRRHSGKSKGGGGGGGGVGASVAEVGVEAAAAAAVEVAVVLVKVALCSVEALVVATASRSSVLVRPCRPRSFVSGTLGVGGLGVLVPGLTFSAPSSAVGRRAEGRTPRSAVLSGVAVFDLDYDAILAAMYAVSISAEGDCYLCVPPDPGIEAAALGAGQSAAPGTGESAL